jgi:hypothetical protein
MRLPNPEQAVVDIAKLRDYCLNTTHWRGQHKARVFVSALGLTAEYADVLREALLFAAKSNEVIMGEIDKFGQRYLLDFEMTGLTGQRAMIRSAWIVRNGEDFPRLTTCYVL